jgi:hypothetical protein
MRKFLPAIILLCFGCRSKDAMFTKMSSSASGILFNNIIRENDSINPIDMEFLYNGGGVAIGDFNNDSLPDIYFTASQVQNKLYLNEGNFSFSDITKEAGVEGLGRWCNAASVVDINNDGLDDIYVCATIKRTGSERKNLLYVNQGKNRTGTPVFKEMAEDYHLADSNMSVQAAFFDYDNDGDLDLYLVQTKLAQRNSSRFDGGDNEAYSSLSDKLYRNEGVPAGKDHPVYKDVSAEAGIKDDGYGLGISIADLNNDGWKDIYVTNDFFGSDKLYMNLRNGRFSDKAKTCLKHTSLSAMGNDIGDINNDGLQDIIAVDMNPEDNFRKKKNMPGNNYFIYQRMNSAGLIYQYVRNTLQLNGGIVKDDSGLAVPVFSDIAFYAGVAETDWSWSPLIADFDNDGHRDLFITNGYPKDVTDQDFTAFNQQSSGKPSKEKLLAEIPSIKVSNYAYRNTGGLKFENVTEKWGLKLPSFSNGAAYVDLDNDGDLDYVVNNINEEAFLYRNNSQKFTQNNFLKIKFRGPEQNRNGLGAIVKVYAGGLVQTAENYPYRGYLSTVESGLHFGLGTKTRVDSIIIVWNDQKTETIRNPAVNHTIIADIRNALPPVIPSSIAEEPLFTEEHFPGLEFQHTEFDYIDFDVQLLLPHKLSEYGPPMAAGDVDGNGYDDLFIGGSQFNESYFFLQQPDGRFLKKTLPALPGKNAPKPETIGALLFDAENDGDLDLYAASGSNEFPENNIHYLDRFYVNDGKGNFAIDSTAIPFNAGSKSCVRAADIDNDGDLDLFVGGRLIPQKYPAPASSFILRNDSKKGLVKFTDITKEMAPGLLNIGLVCDAIWTDHNNDGWTDLMLAGEWMPLTVFRNNKGKLENITETTGLQHQVGLWNSLTGGDFDSDGDIDYVAGNLGENSFYRADSVHPIRIYAGDFGNNKGFFVVPTVFLPDNHGEKHEYPAHTRNDVISQLPALKKRFFSYKSFAEAAFTDVFPEKELKNKMKLSANYLKSAYIENKGNGKFIIHPLPEAAQLAPLNGMLAEDVNDDGELDILVLGNDYGTEVSTGRYDAMNGLILAGNGKGDFRVLPLPETGFYVKGNAKALVKLRRSGKEFLLIASQNRDSLRVFRRQVAEDRLIPMRAGDRYIEYELEDGRKRKEEIYYGNSFLSQSSRFVSAPRFAKKLRVMNASGISLLPFHHAAHPQALTPVSLSGATRY